MLLIATSVGLPAPSTLDAVYVYVYVRATLSPATIFEFVFVNASDELPVRAVSSAPTTTGGTPVIDVTLSVLAVILALS